MPQLKRRFKRRKPTPEELELMAYFDWVRLAYPTALIYHVSNEGRRAKHIAAHIGLMAGIYDISIDEPRGIYHGARIEMKRTDLKSKISQGQLGMGFLYTVRGYFAEICWGWEAAKDATTRYMELV